MRQPDLLVERATVVRLLARKALDAGAEIRGGCKLVDLAPGYNAVTATIRDTHENRVEQFEATLIGVDGTFSRVAKIANENGHRTTPLLQAIVELPPGTQRNITKVWFYPEDTPYFYWLIPESPAQAAVGLIADDGKDAKNKLERFLALQGLKPLEMQAARIPAYTRSSQLRRSIRGSDIYLIGDAAAQVKVTTVGGLVTGLRGAKAAANAILGTGRPFEGAEIFTAGIEPAPAHPGSLEPFWRRGLRSVARSAQPKDGPSFGALQPRPRGKNALSDFFWPSRGF